MLLPVFLTAPADQDVRVSVLPQQPGLLELPSGPTVLFAAGETGPKFVAIRAPDDGRTLGDQLTSFSLVTSSINEPYNGLVSDIEVRVVEVRSVGLLVNPSPVELLAADGGVGTFTVALTSDPLAPVTITFTDASGQLVFAPASIEVSPGLNSVTAQSVTVQATAGSFSGEVVVVASVTSTGDDMYDGVTEELVVYEEAAQGQAILLSRSELSLEEGGEAVYQVALATPPLEEVTVSIGLTWTDGQPRNIVFEPANITFPAGEALTYQTVQLTLPPTEAFLGDGAAFLTHTASSADPRYSSTSGIGARPQELELTVSDSDAVGVCLGGCKNYTPYELFFVDGDQGVPTPYEVVAGTADLKFLLPSEPLADVVLEVVAVFANGTSSLTYPQPGGNLEAGVAVDTSISLKPVTLTFSAANWTNFAPLVLQVRQTYTSSPSFTPNRMDYMLYTHRFPIIHPQFRVHLRVTEMAGPLTPGPQCCLNTGVHDRLQPL